MILGFAATMAAGYGCQLMPCHAMLGQCVPVQRCSAVPPGPSGDLSLKLMLPHLSLELSMAWKRPQELHQYANLRLRTATCDRRLVRIWDNNYFTSGELRTPYPPAGVRWADQCLCKRPTAHCRLPGSGRECREDMHWPAAAILPQCRTAAPLLRTHPRA